VKGFFLAQFAIPWIVAVGISLSSARPVFLERTLLFSQVSLLALFSVQLAKSRSWWLRVLLLALLVPTGMGATAYFSRVPARPPTMTAVVQVLKERSQPGDVLVVRRHNDLFRYRCHALQEGLNELPARISLSTFRTGDFLEMMALALNGEDVVDDHFRVPPDYRRMWLLRPADEDAMSGYGVDRIESIRFRGQTDYALELYVAATGEAGRVGPSNAAQARAAASRIGDKKSSSAQLESDGREP
jgi:hypothetical protein